MKKHWAEKMLNRQFKKKIKIPRILRLPTVVELGKSDIEALPWSQVKSNDSYDWDDYEAEMKRDYPIKYFIYYSFDRWFARNISSKLSKIKYWLISHTIRKYHFLDLRNNQNLYYYGWIDADQQLLFAIMAIMENFIIEQDTKSRIEFLNKELILDPECKDYNWKSEIEFCESLLAIQHWWRIERQEKYKLLEDPPYNFLAEEQLKKEENEMMKKIIDFRGRMWT